MCAFVLFCLVAVASMCFLAAIYHRGVRYGACSRFYFIFVFIFQHLTPRDAPSCVCLPHSLFDLITVPLSLLLHFYFALWRTRCPCSCLPIWVVLHCLYGCLSSPTPIICGCPRFIKFLFLSFPSRISSWRGCPLQATFTPASFPVCFVLFCFL